MLRRDYNNGYRDGLLDAIHTAESMAQQCKKAGDMVGYFHHRKISRRLQTALTEPDE